MWKLESRLPRRWRVVGPGFFAVVADSLIDGSVVLLRWQGDPRAPSVPVRLLGPAYGPFAEPLVTTHYSPGRMVGWAMILLGLIILHPLRPNPVTGVLCGSAIVFWFFLGWCHINIRY